MVAIHRVQTARSHLTGGGAGQRVAGILVRGAPNSSSSSRFRGPGPLAQGPASGRPGGRDGAVARAVADSNEDLMQFADRARWYEARFAADDMPDWNAATLLRRTDLGPGVASLLLSVEVSRERVPLRIAYVAAGQLARVRANSGLERVLPVATPPPGALANREALFMTKGDIFAGDTKTTREPVTTMVDVEVVVVQASAPELYSIQVDDAIEVGPFEGAGLDLRTSGAIAAFRFPTLVLFVSGPGGVAAARALLESPGDVADLALELRQEVVVYYQAPNDASILYRDRFPEWSARGPVRVVTTTRGFGDAFDGDDQLLYDPDTTAAIILVGGDEEAEAAAREVCAEAEITTIVTDSAPATPPKYLDSTPLGFRRWATADGSEGRKAEAAKEGNGGEEEEGQEGQEGQEEEEGEEGAVRGGGTVSAR